MCSFGSCQTRFEFLSQFRKVRNAFAKNQMRLAYEDKRDLYCSREIEMTRPENAPPTVDPNLTLKKMPENLTLVSTPMTSPTWLCVDSPRSPTVEYVSVNRMTDSREIEMTRPENAPPMIDPIVIQKNMPKNLAPLSTPMTAFCMAMC